MKGDILVLAEQKSGKLDNITYELLAKGREIADQWGTKLAVLIAGNDLGPLTQILANAGADVVLVVDNPTLSQYSAEKYCTVISRAVKDFKPALMLLGYTYFGIEVGPSVAARSGMTMVSNCVNLESANDEGIVVIRPMYGGTINTRVESKGTGPYIVSFAKGVLPNKKLPLRPAPVVPIAVEMDESALRSKVLGFLEIPTGEIDITKADIIVSVGRGIGDKSKIPVAQELADVLGGTIACSRPVADMGWLPVERQVGISAKTVTPKVYIACGISGASQHVAAMRDSGLIIAINKDPNAPIFGVAHCGVVGDLFEIIPYLVQEARKSS